MLALRESLSGACRPRWFSYAPYKRDWTDINVIIRVSTTILVGDSGVGKTSLLVQFDQGTFQTGSFAATVGIGFTVRRLCIGACAAVHCVNLPSLRRVSVQQIRSLMVSSHMG
ncbi:hypothetical protein LSAT2_032798 [Lamellibrachia satsuma]|nr:hypothetical protein LSAT2_032798 [Lamellibrachia satsuma]